MAWIFRICHGGINVIFYVIALEWEQSHTEKHVGIFPHAQSTNEASTLPGSPSHHRLQDKLAQRRFVLRV